MNLALVFNLACRHLGDAYQILIWHRLEVESAALLIDRAIRRLVFLLLLCQLSILIKTFFNGQNFASFFVAGLFCATLMLFVRYLASTTIRPDIFDLSEEEETLTPQVLLSWWNKYRHPLVSEAEENIKSAHAAESKPGSPVLYGKHRTSLALSVIDAFRGSRQRDRPYHFSYLPKQKQAFKKLPGQDPSLELQTNPFATDTPREPSTTDKLAQKVRSMIEDSSQPQPRLSEPTPAFQSFLQEDLLNTKPRLAVATQAPAFIMPQPRRRQPNFYDPVPRRPRPNS